jgi:hypothetical protein
MKIENNDYLAYMRKAGWFPGLKLADARTN